MSVTTVFGLSLLQLLQPSVASPVDKALELLTNLQGKIVAEGKETQKTYEEFAEWCEERSKALQFEIKTGSNDASELQASIAKDTASIGAFNAKLEELTADISTDEADLKAATEIRDKEAADFTTEQNELTEVISMLQRALSILAREMAKGGESLLQSKNIGNVAQALNAMVQASMMSAADSSRLTALVQNAQSSEGGDADTGAPDAAVYEGHSGSIIDTLQGLLDKAETQLEDARKTETTNTHNYQMLAQSLKDEIRFAKSDMEKAKKGLAASSGSKATAEGALAVTSKDLAADKENLGNLHQMCLTKSQDYEAATKSRDEELSALAAAKKAISESTDGANQVQYGLSQMSLLQTQSSANLLSRVSHFVWDLAQKKNSRALAQLASRMSTASKSNAQSGDAFAKVKSLISDMISRLESDADADATQKAYCDKELRETTAKKDDKTSEIDKLTAAIDDMTSRSSLLKEEVSRLQKELAELAASQADMNKLRAEEEADFTSKKADLDEGIAGVKLALKVLREYYANDDKDHEEAQGAGQGIIGLLEVIESDFSKNLAESTSVEEAAIAAYEKQTKENSVDKAAKEQDVKYKSKESAELDKAADEAKTDRSNVQAELDAVQEYLDSLNKQCTEKAEPYEERKRRREEELAGLKEALTILQGESALIQKASHRALRSAQRH